MTIRLIGLITLCLVPMFVSASGSGGLGGGRSFGGNYELQTDPAYEQGKAIFKGRIKEYGKVKYCLAATTPETDPIKIKRKSMKAYKNSSVQALVNDLRFCNAEAGDPTKVLTHEDMSYLLYFLNKRYRLKLS